MYHCCLLHQSPTHCGTEASAPRCSHPLWYLIQLQLVGIDAIHWSEVESHHSHRGATTTSDCSELLEQRYQWLCVYRGRQILIG